MSQVAESWLSFTSRLFTQRMVVTRKEPSRRTQAVSSQSLGQEQAFSAPLQLLSPQRSGAFARIGSAGRTSPPASGRSLSLAPLALTPFRAAPEGTVLQPCRASANSP